MVNITFLGFFYELLILVKLKADVMAVMDKFRVARLATVDNSAQPHLVPVVFAFDGEFFFIPLDEKAKGVRPDKLKRVKNIQKNPNVALLIDEYNEDWRKLFFIMIRGRASIVYKEQGKLLAKAHKLLFIKYTQYEKIGVGDSCIMVEPQRVTSWNFNEL
jgi:PPOX class probable F420-dependent enzyme